MPEDKEKPDYISTVYTNLKNAYGDNFQRTEEDFRDKMSKDFEYRKTVHKNLQGAYGDGFKKDFNTFNFQLPSIPRPNQPVTQAGISDANIEDISRTQDYSKDKVDVQKIQDNMAASNIQPSPSGGQKIKQANTYKDIDNWVRVNAQKKSSDEQLTEQDPESLKRSIDINSKVAAKLFLGQNVGKDAENFGKYLMHMSSESPEKYEELVTKVGMYGPTLTEKEKFDLKNEANNYVGGKINQDQQIFKARGYDKKFEQYAGISKKFKAIENEINSYGDISSIPDDKKIALKTKIDDLNKQKEDFESNPDNMTAVDKYASLHDKYDDYLKAQNKILQDSPSMLKKQLEMDKIKTQEAAIESGTKAPGTGDYLTNEIAGNVYNTVIDAAENVMLLTKDISDKALNVVGLNKGYSPNDRLFDGLKSLVDSNIKATVSDTDMFDDKGNLRSYRIMPNVAKVATDMAIQLAPVGRLAKLGETAKLSSVVADNMSVASSNFMTQYGNYKQEGIAQGLSDKDAEMYGLAQGIVNSALQLVSPNREIRGMVPKEKLFDMVKTYAEQGAGAFTKKEAFNKMLSEITDITFSGVKEVAKENIQEDLESISEKAINAAFNASNKNYKLAETVTPKELKENLILTTIVTGGAHAGSAKKNQSSIVDGATLGLLDNYDESMKILSDMKDSGKISDSDYDRVSQQLEATKEIYDKIPDNFSEATKHNLMPLLREKATLEERGKRVDPTLRLRDAKKLDDIDKTLSAYYEKETSEPTAKSTEQKAEPTEQENKEEQKQVVPLSDEEVGKLSNGAEVMIMDEGSLVKATVNEIKDNGEVIIDLPGGKRKIVLDRNFVKEEEQKKTDIGAELAPEHIASLQKQDVTQTPEQQISKEEKATQVWAVAVKNRLGKVFKGTDVAFTQQEFDDAASRSEHPNAINANAFVDRGTNKIYLNPKKFKKDTPIHEFGHIWTDVLKDANPEVYEKVLQTARTSDFYKQTKANSNYAHLSDNDIAEEAFVQALGKKGVDVFNDIADRNVYLQRVSDMWSALKSALGVDEKITVNDDTTFEELVGKAAEDLSKSKASKKSNAENKESFSIEKPSLVEKAGVHKEMTEDDKGNYIFYHYSSKELKKIDPNKFGSNTMATGRDENPGVGISMYYTRPDRAEANVPDDFGHIVRIPKDKVYPIDSDPLNFYDEAKKLFEKEHPGQAFDGNKQAGYISKVAAKNGFPMTVAKWNIGKTKALRAQTTEPLKAEKYSKKEGWSVKFANEEVENFKPNATRKDKKNLKFQIEETAKKDYDTTLTPEEQKVSDDLEKDLTENYEARKAEYISKHGLVFDTDKARAFSPAYQKNPELLSNATQIPARTFVSRMYAEELAKPAPEGKVNAVLFTAGGSGVGKSKTVANLDLDQQLTVDTNLSNFERGVKDIQQALDAGKQVNIVFTYRDPKEAFVSKEGGVVERAKREGRTVPYDVATAINEKALTTIIKLSEHFKGDDRVQFAYFNNSFSKGDAQPITLDDVKEIKPDYSKAKEDIKNEIDRQYKSGELESGKFKPENLYAGLIGDSGTLKRVLGEMAQEGPGGLAEGTKQAGFQFEPESDAGRELTGFIKGRLEAGIPEEKIRQYLKENKLSDKFIDDAVKSATEKPRDTKKEPAENVQKNEPVQEPRTAKKTEQPKVEQTVEVNGKIVDISRVPVNSRINTVLGRVFNNPEAPQTLIDALTKRFGSREQMLKSKRLSQSEARELGGEIVKAFDNLNDAIEFATSKGYEIDGDIQAAILDNVISAAYDAEKKATSDADREYYQNIQTKALDEIASAGEQSGRRISYYQMMYNVNPQIFGNKMYEAIRTMQDAVLDKKIGDSYKSADEKISSFAKESKDAVNAAKEKAASKNPSEYKGPKYQGPKTNKSQSEIDAIRKTRNAKMEEIKKKLKGDSNKPGEKFSFEKPDSTPIDQNKVNAIKDIGDTFIDEGYLTYSQWSRKVENEFKNAGITVYGKELQEAWNKSNDKVSSAIKEAYKNLPAQEVQSLIEAQSKAKVQELPLAIKSILADAQVSKDMKDKVKNRLINELGLSSGYAQHITDSFMKEFETQAKKQVTSKLKEITNKGLLSTFKKPKKEAEERIVNDIVSGTFEGAELKPSFYEMYGMEDVSKNTGLKDKLVEMAQRVATQQQGSLMKDKALRDLYNEIQKHKPLSKWQIGTDVYYSSLLSGYETHIKNFVLYNALQTYVNKPLQIAFQNMMSGNKSKAASSIYSKELAKFMYNEAKGIVLTGTNSFYDKPKTESEMETFAKSGGKNPLKSLWRYAKLPTRFLAAEDAFGTLGLSEMKSRQLMYDKIKHEAEKEGEKVDPEQINQEVNKALGWTKSAMEAAKINAEQSLKNYYGENFNLKEELTKKPANKEEKIRQETIKSEYKREAYRSMLKERDAEVTQKAMDWSKTALLQNEPEGSLGRVYIGVQALVNQLPFLRAFVPFLKVPLNVANNLIHTTPGLSLIRLATKRKGIFGGTKMTKEEIQEHKQKAITYTALTAALMALQGVEDEEGKPFFYVTGKNGQNYSESIAREQAGKGEPYTVYVGGVPILKYQYTPWMPLFTTLGIANDMRLENGGNLNDEEYTDVVTNAFLKYANTINEQAALKGVNEVINTVQDFYNDFYKGKGDAESRLNDFVTKKVAGITKTLLVPNAATQANTDIKALFDADRIASTSFMDDVIKDMPIVDIVSQQFFGNESKIDVLGRPIKEKFSVAGYDKEFPESIGLKTPSEDEYYKLFVGKHYLPFAYNKRALKVNIEDDSGEIKATSIPLSPKQRYDANLMRGKLLYDYITENMESLKEMTDAEFQSDIKAQIKTFDQQTEQELFPQE